jgi:CBS domain containing-hemolysin-like protein
VIDFPAFLAILILLAGLDIILVAARASFLGTTHGRLLALRDQEESRVMRTSALLIMPDRLRASLNFFLMLIRFLLASLVVSRFIQQPVENSFIQIFLPLAVTGLVVFLLEGAVERLVARSPELWALRLDLVVRFFMVLASPFVALLGFPKETPGPQEAAGLVTEDELKTLVDAGQEEGVFEQGERRMIYSIFNLSDTLAREIMIPRIDMLALDVNTPLLEAVDTFLSSGHSRVPVFQETVDNTLGLLYAKDLLRVWREGEQIATLKSLLRPAYFIPEAKKVNELLTEMQLQRVHMAIVVDEYGGVAGLVTLEDIVEEVVGEIQDEYDQAEELPYQLLETGEYIFQGRVDLDDFNEIMGSTLPKEDADTIGGFIYSRTGRVPDVGDTVLFDGLRLTVEHVSGRRIRKVRAQWASTELERKEGENEAAGSTTERKS